MTANYDFNQYSWESIVNFNYEMSPITVQFYKYQENIFDFLVKICAIVGGVFTIAGIADSLIHKSVSIVFKKRIGKLN